MDLTDVMSHAGLADYAVVALVLFALAFALITIRTLLPSRRREMDEASRLPLNDEPHEAGSRGVTR